MMLPDYAYTPPSSIPVSAKKTLALIHAQKRSTAPEPPKCNVEGLLWRGAISKSERLFCTPKSPPQLASTLNGGGAGGAA